MRNLALIWWLLGLLQASALAQTTTCQGFQPTGWTSGSGAGFIDGVSGCQIVDNVLWGDNSPPLASAASTAVVLSASLCGQACTGAGANGTACNIFNWCSSPMGCCLLPQGCADTATLSPYGTCILRKQANLTQPNQDLGQVHSDAAPGVLYNASQTQQWDSPASAAAGLVSSAHSFTSGVCGNLSSQNDNWAAATQAQGFCSVTGADLPGQNYLCPTEHGLLAANASTACHINATLEEAADMCYSMANCSALVYQSSGCCNQTDFSPSAWFKTGPVAAASTVVLPYSSLYIKTGLARPAPPAPAPAPPSNNTPAIAGGVVGGILGALLLSLAAFAFVVRRRTGRWPLLGSSKHQDAFMFDSNGRDNDHGAILINHQFQSTGSSRASGTTNSSGPTSGDEADATTLLRKMQSSSFAPATRSGQGWRVRPTEIEILRDGAGKDIKLGEGGFGTVYKGKMGGITGGLDVAVKVLKGKQDDRTQQAFSKEIEILSNARHPNVLQFIGAVLQEHKTFLVTEFMDGGDLWSALAKDNTEFSWNRRGQTVAFQISQALAYLHTREQVVLHLDLKSQNVLLTSSGHAKLADVGLARVLHAGDYTRADGTGWTWAYASPEVLVGDQCGIKADVWSFGVLLWEIVTCEVPQRGNLRAVRVPEEAPPEIDDLIWRCLLHDPKERPHTLDIVNLLSKAVGLSH